MPRLSITFKNYGNVKLKDMKHIEQRSVTIEELYETKRHIEGTMGREAREEEVIDCAFSHRKRTGGFGKPQFFDSRNDTLVTL